MTERASTAITRLIKRLRDTPTRLVTVDLLNDAADRIEYLESLVAADEWTIRTVLNDLARGRAYDATLSLETALATHTDNGSDGADR